MLWVLQGVSEDHLNQLLTQLQQQIQGKDYQLQMLNSSAIIIFDRQRYGMAILHTENSVS